MFSKVLVANRGEIAVRVIRALDELGIASVAVYSEADRDAQHVQRADEAYLLGPGPGGAVLPRRRQAPRGRSSSRAPRPSTPATASSPRTPRSPQRLEEAGVTFIGPPASAIEAMGSKTRARELMQAAGVPIVPGDDRAGRRRRGRGEDRRRRSATRSRSRPRAAAAARASASRSSRRQARGGVRGRRARGREVLLRRDRLPRALPARPAPRRGPGARRRPRQRHPPRRARLLDPAPPPEADRGVAGAARRRGAARADRRRSPPRPPARSATAARARSRACSRTASTSSSR